MLFNSEVWSNLLERDIKHLQCLQMKFLKNILNVPQSTANSFMCLEFGVPPIKYEIHKKQLMFLHHIMSLGGDDPVKVLWENMKLLSGEQNWWKEVQKLLTAYKLEEEDIRKASRETCKEMVAVCGEALKNLVDECKSKAKTRNLQFNNLKVQEYLKCLFPQQSRLIFQCRSKILDIKQYRSYKYSDNICRGCKQYDEVLTHIVNCGYSEAIDISIVDNMDNITKPVKLIMITNRIESFIESVADGAY